ncbi:MAG: SufD family Fe-S cluster assembly protein [Actinomycetota bacterium]|nr:SufD family Fe-S cluster assembly protein [Actinomycetota bacterium]
MSTVTTPPLDLSPRVHSFNALEFHTPTGREEEWRFSPLEGLRKFFVSDEQAGSVIGAGSPALTLIPNAEIPLQSIPSDLPSAVARAGVQQGNLIQIPAEAIWPEPVVIDLTSTTAVAYQHVEIQAGAFSTATVVLRQQLTGDVNGTISATLGDGAHLTVITILEGELTPSYAMHMPVFVGRDATYVGALAALAGGAVRVNATVEYLSTGGKAELIGAFLAETGQHIEQRVFVEHEQPHCTSDVLYKGALMSPGARSVWIGDVLVRKQAIGTDTHQVNRNLLLSEGARADSVPNLELETGEIVRAGHASATGRFDDEQLFYLQSRGLPLEVARQLVVRGFFAEVLSRIGNVFWRETLLAQISDRLGITSPDSDDDE